ncbi:hypothetical protein, partial [Enterococcus sp.]|uniref:hypothetical protein n=1 Tax=Enterococcus sp. TaxID=35783 RepID=UPI0025B7C23C
HYWKEGIKEWDGFKIQNLVFFDRMVDDLGFLPETLFSIAGFINTIGHPFIKEGVEWISKIISENNKLTASQLPTNTEYYLEEIVLSFSSEYEEEARKVDHFRNHLLRILNFLVSRGSTVGFLIREELF